MQGNYLFSTRREIESDQRIPYSQKFELIQKSLKIQENKTIKNLDNVLFDISQLFLDFLIAHILVFFTTRWSPVFLIAPFLGLREVLRLFCYIPLKTKICDYLKQGMIIETVGRLLSLAVVLVLYYLIDLENTPYITAYLPIFGGLILGFCMDAYHKFIVPELFLFISKALIILQSLVLVLVRSNIIPQESVTL